MSDIKRVLGSVGNCEGPVGKRGERGERGATGPTGPGADAVPTPPFGLSTITIFARPAAQGGSDTQGNGTASSPFLTFQRAIREVPNIIAPGTNYIVDITNLGVETLPVDYELPVIMAPTLLGGSSNQSPPFAVEPGLSVRATPQLVAGKPPVEMVILAGANAIVSADPDTGLVILTVPLARASWTTGLKGKQIIRTVGSSDTSCCIYDSNSTQLFLCNTIDGVQDISGIPGPLDLAPGETLRIVEPSATLEAPPPTNADGRAIRCANINSVAFQGIRFRCTVPDTAFALLIGPAAVPVLELCDVDGLLCTANSEEILLLATTLRLGFDTELTAAAPTRSYWTDIGTGSAGYLFFEGICHLFRATVIEGCVPIESGVLDGVCQVPSWAFNNTLILNSTGDGIHCTGGRFELNNVKIEGSLGNGLNAEKGSNYLLLNHVTGAGNVGFGVKADDGAFVQITDTTTAPGSPTRTTVTGTIDDTSAGSLGPTPYSSGMNAFDIPPNALIAVSTGTRIFEKA